MDSNSFQPNKGESSDAVAIIEEKITRSNGETIVKRYSKGKLLGKGGFAKCFEIVNLETNKVLAAKIIQKSSLTKTRSRQKLISEIKIHKSLHHVHIVAFEHVFEDSENVYILLELCTNQTLNDLLKRRKRLTELEVQCYVVQIVGALKYLHAHKVIHRDLKLGNLFINDKMEIKLGDFGLATKLDFDGEKKRTICGTPNYIAPEVLDGKVGHSYEVDVWSLGVIIYTLLVGKPPFETPDVKTTYKKIKMNSYAFPEHVPLSDSVKDLISKIFNLDPSKRPTLDELLAHSFIEHGGNIPRVLPTSTMHCPPPASYIKQFLPLDNPIKLMVQPQRLIDTLPAGQQSSSSRLPENQRSNLISTDKAPLSKMTNEAGTINFNGTGTNFKTKDLKTTNTEGGLTGVPPVMGSSNKPKSNERNEAMVKKWINYSSKYGIGYLLSNGATGVYFNDSTKIVLDANGEKFHYVDRRPADRQDVMTTHSMTDYPKELQKKVTLLSHFKNFLENDKETNDNKNVEMIEEGKKTEGPAVYVKKWMKTKHAVMFRLSNKIVQVNFADKTEIILSSENKMVTYVNKKSEKSLHPLATALESNNTEMVKRLKYTKEILTNMLNNGQQRENGGGEQNAGAGPEEIAVDGGH